MPNRWDPWAEDGPDTITTYGEDVSYAIITDETVETVYRDGRKKIESGAGEVRVAPGKDPRGDS